MECEECSKNLTSETHVLIIFHDYDSGYSPMLYCSDCARKALQEECR